MSDKPLRSISFRQYHEARTRDEIKHLESELAAAKEALRKCDERELDLVKELNDTSFELGKTKAELEWLSRIAYVEHGNCDRDTVGYYCLRFPNGTDYYKGGKLLPFIDAIDAARKAKQ